MMRSLPALLKRTINPFTSLRVGDMIVGWIALRLEKGNNHGGMFSVAVGQNTWELSYNWFIDCCKNLNLEIPMPKRTFVDFEADILVYVPRGSIDFYDGVHVNYSDRTVLHLHAALTNFLRALESNVQSRLNGAEFPEAVDMYEGLLKRYYPYSAELTWRGQKATTALKA